MGTVAYVFLGVLAALELGPEWAGVITALINAVTAWFLQRARRRNL
jgi:membrane protein implicated in regulation of membrane protease activity